MLKATNEEWGMVAGLAVLSQALEDEHMDGKLLLFFPGYKKFLIIPHRHCTICSQPMMTF